MRILYVEDERALAEAVVYLLNKANIDVDWVDNGEDGLEMAIHNDYDCIVLDWMLPKMSGQEILQSLRRAKNMTPIIILSALSSVEDKVTMLDMGADDYLAKPFKTSELIARLKALVRRPPMQIENVMQYSDLDFNPQTRELNTIVLTAKEAKLMELFLRYPEQTLPKERLLQYVWGNEKDIPNNYVEVQISYLRRKLNELGSKVKITAIRNLGYKLVGEKDV